MGLRICHLSDIHFIVGKNAIEEKKDKLCSAILEYAHKGEEILFLISGDIAQSCDSKQYNIAMDFFLYIQEELQRQKNIKSYFVFSSGNHDAILDPDDFDEANRRSEILKKKDVLTPKELIYYQEKMCEKQKNYFAFVNLFFDETVMKKIETQTPLLEQYIIKIAGQDIFINILNTPWISQRNEKPGEIFIPKAVYEKRIVKKNGLNITMYHHPSNWMHPDDKIQFDSVIRNHSDIIFVGHEHDGREEHIITRETEFDIEYGEVLQDLDNEDNSSFKIHYIENENICTHVYKWDRLQKIYGSVELPIKKLGENMNKSLCFINKYRDELNSLEMQISHPNKKKVVLNDLFIFPNIEVYNRKRDLEENTKEKITVYGEGLIEFILEKKYIEFSAGPKVGKSALSKMLSLKLEQQGIHAIIINCKNLSNFSIKNVEKAQDKAIYNAFGKEKMQLYRQLSIDKKMIILDNIDCIKNEKLKREIMEYFSNFYKYVISFTGMSYELAMLKDVIRQNDGFKITHCTIKELGHKQRDRLYRKWYSLDEGDGIFIDEEIEKKIKEATNTINTLKGNGYMPCIAPNIIIILQQLEFQSERNSDRSNYGYMYEFLINKSIMDMKKNCPTISEDIASGILVWVAQFMLQNKCKIIDYHKFVEIVTNYNKNYITEASEQTYLREYEKVDLIEYENEQIKFKYPYIYYYFIAKFLASHMTDQAVKNTVYYMSNNLHDEECGDIMVFLCHLSKVPYIFNSVLESSRKLLQKSEIFDFSRHKDKIVNLDEFLDVNFIPEEGKEERREIVLDRKDEYEEEKQQEKTEIILKDEEDSKKHNNVELQQKMELLDAAYKSIEVMGQILKNYPGTIDGNVKIDLLLEAHALGMRALTFTDEVLKCEIEKAYNEVQEEVMKKIHQQVNNQDPVINEEVIWNNIKKQFSIFTVQMDNLFGLMAYSVIRRLSNALGNEELKTLINYIKLDDIISYKLMKFSIYLNEFGILQGESIIGYYEKLKKNKNIFASKLLKLFVYEHYFVFGSNDIRMRQRIWSILEFQKKQGDMILLAQMEKN